MSTTPSFAGSLSLAEGLLTKAKDVAKGKTRDEAGIHYKGGSQHMQPSQDAVMTTGFWPFSLSL